MRFRVLSFVLAVGVSGAFLSEMVVSRADLLPGTDRKATGPLREKITGPVSDLPGGSTGGDVSSPGTVPQGTSEQRAQAQSKLTLSTVYEKWQEGEVGDGRLKEEMRHYEDRFGREVLGRDGVAATFHELAQLKAASGNTNPGNSTDVSTQGFTAVRRVRGVAHHAQVRSYYCGPAAAYSIIEYVRGTKKKSAWDGRRLSQTNLARSPYLNTDARRATPWSAGRMKVTLNRWISGSNKGWYVDKASPTPAEFKKALAWNIDRRRPFAVDAVEMRGNKHYNGHPVNQTIGHWLVVRGYSGSGAVAHFVDPLARSSAVGWSNPRPYFTGTPTAFTKNFLQSNGMTW
ncbi:MAG: hypothetical protein QG608_1506 [Actinomycetota bacterium]|nr:hypothetical protein [Actinomycetota bacterium]